MRTAAESRRSARFPVLAGPYGRPPLWPLRGDDDALALATVGLGGAARARDCDPLVHPGVDRRTDVYGILNEGAVL
jgi:hypothetical protein